MMQYQALGGTAIGGYMGYPQFVIDAVDKAIEDGSLPGDVDRWDADFSRLWIARFCRRYAVRVDVQRPALGYNPATPTTGIHGFPAPKLRAFIAPRYPNPDGTYTILQRLESHWNTVRAILNESIHWLHDNRESLTIEPLHQMQGDIDMDLGENV